MKTRFSSLLLLITAISCPLSPEAAICMDSICEYEFSVDLTRTMQWLGPGGNYFDVRLNGSNVLRVVATAWVQPTDPTVGTVVDPDDVITADGIPRNIITINGQFPGPTLEVMEDAQVVVRVTNNLPSEGVTIHWHGQHHRGTCWMDGIPYITQCPIHPRQSFTYRFIADPAGTFWYHTHIEYQRMDGLQGMLIIHRTAPSMPYFPVMIQDWRHETGQTYGAANRGAGSDFWVRSPVPDMVDTTINTIQVWISGLINGRGRADPGEQLPLTVFTVSQGTTYRFRVVNAGAETALIVSIDGHTLAVVALDGFEVRAIKVDRVILGPAERVDFEVVADRPVGQYWMRSKKLLDPMLGLDMQESLAIVRYEGFPGEDDPTTSSKSCTSSDRCVEFNCPFWYYPDFFYIDCVHIEDARHEYTLKEFAEYDLSNETPERTYFFNIQLFEGSFNFNGIRDVARSVPVFQTDSMPVSCEGCAVDESCTCTHRIKVPYNKIVHLVLINRRQTPGPIQAHIIHLHGHHGAVLAQGFANYTYGGPSNSIRLTPNPDIECDSPVCREAFWSNGQPTLNLDEPPLKDSVYVPASGYTVLRIRTDNPGPWFLHCHMQHHLVDGPLRLLLEIAPDRYPPVPPHFPTCQKQFELTTKQFYDLLKDAADQRKAGGFTRVDPKRCVDDGDDGDDSDDDDGDDDDDDDDDDKGPSTDGDEELQLNMLQIIGIFIAGLVVGFLITLGAFLMFICCQRMRQRIIVKPVM